MDQETLDRLRQQIDRALRDHDWTRAAELHRALKAIEEYEAARARRLEEAGEPPPDDGG